MSRTVSTGMPTLIDGEYVPVEWCWRRTLNLYPTSGTQEQVL